MTVNPPSTKSVNALELSRIKKTYQHVEAVRDASFTLRAGQFLTLLGPSGCGKTTTLRLIAGFEEPDSGSISIHGRRVAGEGAHVPPESRRVGMVFQDYALFPHLNVRDNVGFGLRGDKRVKSDRIAEVLTLVGLNGYDDRMPNALSGGQQQRVALARALAPQPELLLLDEPFSNLDAALRGQVRGELRAILKQAGVTVVFVTHDQEEALSLSDWVAVMFNGDVVQVAPPRTLYTRPATREVADFVGEAYWIPAEGLGPVARSALGEIKLVEARNGPCSLLIRPESLILDLTGEVGAPAHVVWREYYGHHQRVGLRVSDGSLLVARADPDLAITPGQPIGVALPTAALAF
jgi:iron(III) transport system ATP-binding protein